MSEDQNVGALHDAAGGLSQGIAKVLRTAAEQSVMPRFRRLAAGEIEEKAPGELVTVADREAERIIQSGLKTLCPSARFVGEEAASANPALLDDLGKGEVWIVDPIDGTANYAAGRSPFALMAALLVDGAIVASAILDPVRDQLTIAERGAGAWLDGQRIKADEDPRDLADTTGIVSAFQRPALMESRIRSLSARCAQIAGTQRCAGHEYPLVAAGAYDFALYWRSLPWDHAPGALVIQAAGGKIARLDGSPYRPADPSGPVLLARSPEIWDQLAALLAQ